MFIASSYFGIRRLDVKVKDKGKKTHEHGYSNRICKKGSYSLSNCMHLTVHCDTCEYGTNLKFYEHIFADNKTITISQ